MVAVYFDDRDNTLAGSGKFTYSTNKPFNKVENITKA